MQLRNKHGTPVDPVPFLVVVLCTVMVGYSYGPLYLMALGLGLGDSLLVTGSVTALVTWAAHHRFVWTARPDLASEVPAAVRFKRLFYAVLIGVVALVLLALPLVGRY